MNDNRRLYNPVLEFVLLMLLIVFSRATATGQIWTVIGAKSKGTARDPALAAAAQLSYRYDKLQDFLWFRVRFPSLTKIHR